MVSCFLVVLSLTPIRVILGDNHYVAAFERYFFIISFPWQQEMMRCIRYSMIVIPVAGKHRVIKENIFHQQSFSCPCFFCRLIQQDMIIDSDPDIPGKNKIGNRRKNHFVFIDGAADKNFCQLFRRKVKNRFAYHRNNFRWHKPQPPVLILFHGLLIIRQQPLQLNYIFRFKEIHHCPACKNCDDFLASSISESLPFIFAGSRKYSKIFV